jgi:hypothetical protein
MSTSEDAWRQYHESAGAWESWVDAKIAEAREHVLAVMAEVLAGVQRDFERTVLEMRAAARPADGRDGRSLIVRDTYDANTRYHALDVVALDGASFVARRDSPGPCPGDGWQLIARQGPRGRPGERGERGERGQDGINAPTLERWIVNRSNRTATPVYSNGIFGPVLDLRALFEPEDNTA